MDIKIREMLVKLNDLIRPEDLKTMKYFCKDIIPTKTRDQIKTSLDLFEKLEERGKLKPNDLSFLKLLFENTCASRTDLLDIFHSYINMGGTSKNKADAYKDARVVDEPKELSLTFDFLMKNMGREYLMVLRRLGVQDSVLDQLQEEYPRNVQEVIHRGLKHWYKSNADSACQETIILALQAERRNDLANKIARGNI